MNRKGQAAMEFLMTYGWAILAAVIAIGVLSYMGVFSPGKYATDNAIVTAPFYANAHSATASGGVTLELKNNGGETYTVTDVNVGGCGNNSASTSIGAGNMSAITITCNPVLTAGDTVKGDITVTYNKAGSSVSQTSTGTVSSKVTA
jgi:hypothetical protein